MFKITEGRHMIYLLYYTGMQFYIERINYVDVSKEGVYKSEVGLGGKDFNYL